MSGMNTSLMEALRNRSKPLKITIDGYGCIAADRHDFGGPFEVGIIFDHPEGPIVVGADPPSRAEYRGLDDVDFQRLSYPEKKHIVEERFGFEEEEQLPWIRFDASGQSFADTDTEARMMAWLAEPTESDDDLGWVPRRLSEYLPGFEIMDALSKEVQEKLGLREVDIGGMASGGCWAVKLNASTYALDKALRAAGLPFRVARSTSTLPPWRKS